MTIDLSDEEIALLFFALGAGTQTAHEQGMWQTAADMIDLTGKVQQLADSSNQERTCSACGISLSWAHERSMGPFLGLAKLSLQLYCHATANGMHQFENYPQKDPLPRGGKLR